jgi:hypothetical protein
MTSGDFPSATGTTYGERWNQDARFKLRGGARPAVAGVGAAVALIMAVSVVHLVRRPLRASRRDEWARAARELGLTVPEQMAA